MTKRHRKKWVDALSLVLPVLLFFAVLNCFISVNDSTFIPKQFLLWARNEYTIKVDGTALTALDAGDNDSAYRRFSAVQAA